MNRKEKTQKFRSIFRYAADRLKIGTRGQNRNFEGQTFALQRTDLETQTA